MTRGTSGLCLRGVKHCAFIEAWETKPQNGFLQHFTHWCDEPTESLPDTELLKRVNVATTHRNCPNTKNTQMHFTEEQLLIPPLQKKATKLTAKHCAARRSTPALFFCIYFLGLQHSPVAGGLHARRCALLWRKGEAKHNARTMPHRNRFSDSKSTSLWHWKTTRQLCDTFKPLGKKIIV